MESTIPDKATRRAPSPTLLTPLPIPKTIRPTHALLKRDSHSLLAQPRSEASSNALGHLCRQPSATTRPDAVRHRFLLDWHRQLRVQVPVGRQARLRRPLAKPHYPSQGISGNRESQWIGTVKWPVIDDEGRHHDLLIPNAVLVPKGSLPFRLLSPQHFAQENYAQRIDKQPRGTLSLTSGMDHILSWADQHFTITAPLTTGSNIVLISSSTGYSKFVSFVSLVDAPDEPMALFRHHLIPNDDDYDLTATEDTTSSVDGNISTHEGEHEEEFEGGTPTSATNNQSSTQLPSDQPHVVSFLLSENCMPIVEEAEDNEEKLDNPQHELLLYHYRLGHESFTNLQSMAKAGILPTWLASCRIPQCAACHYGKASKVPWRVKGDPKDGKLFEATVAGQVVLVDQLQSTVPGLVGQMKGWPTTQC
jgi:hypothetical protein